MRPHLATRLSSFSRAASVRSVGGRLGRGGGTGEEEEGEDDETGDNGLMSEDIGKRRRRSLVADGATMNPYLLTNFKSRSQRELGTNRSTLAKTANSSGCRSVSRPRS